MLQNQVFCKTPCLYLTVKQVVGLLFLHFLEIVRMANRFLLEVLNRVQDEQENR